MVKTAFKGKCIIVGDSAVGKTSLISCFVEHKFPQDYLPTIGTNLYVKELQPTADTSFQLTCWDIAGEKKWTVMRTLYYKGASGAFMVGDLTRPETFENLHSYWLEDLKKYCPGVPIVLLANKADLGPEIEPDAVQSFGTNLGALRTFITSARTSMNVDEAFNTMLRAMFGRDVHGLA